MEELAGWHQIVKGTEHQSTDLELYLMSDGESL